MTKDPRFSALVIDPTGIPKFRDALPTPGANWPVIDLTGPLTSTTLKLQYVDTQILPENVAGGAYPTTPGWVYRGTDAYNGTFLGPSILAKSKSNTVVTYDYSSLNNFQTHILKRGGTPKAQLLSGPSVIDRQVHGTDSSEPEVRFIAHLHGAAGVAPGSDGYTESWSTPTSMAANGTEPAPLNDGAGKWKHTYPSDQGASFAWYHDHALGITRLNVYAGGAGAFLINDDNQQYLIDKKI